MALPLLAGQREPISGIDSRRASPISKRGSKLRGVKRA
jgi:hypothetical protein